MDEYISREEAIDKMRSLKSKFRAKNDWDSGYDTAIAEAFEHIKRVPAAGVQPVKHGKWIDCTFYDPCEKSWKQDFEYKCSNCGHKIYNKPNDNNLFCGHCSARMDLKDGDTNG